jgi:dienelactone hydrolase
MTKPRLFIVALLSLLVLSASGATAPSTAPARFEAADLQLDLGRAGARLGESLSAFEPKLGERFAYTVTPMPGPNEPELRVLRVTFPSPVVTPYPENNTVPAELYLPAKLDGPLPAAIVLDILDGTAIVPRALARALALRGVAALYFPMPYYNVRKPKGNVQLRMLDVDMKYVSEPFRQTVMDARRAKAILASRPEIDPKRIGITGVSLGGISAALVAGVDGHFYRVAPVIAGGDLATITFHCREMRRMRELFLRHGVDRDALAKLLEPVEPLNYASRIDPSTCLMINASRDEVIPRKSTDALRVAIGSPTILWMPVGHYGCILFMPNIEQKVADFMLGKPVSSLDFDRPARKD